MSSTGSRLRELSPTWRYALLGGLASIPFTAASYWQTGDELSMSAVFVAALVAGYLAKRRGVKSSAVGLRAGLVGSLPAVLIVSDVLTLAAVGLSGPPWFRAAGLLGSLLFSLALLVLAGMVSALFGWLGGRFGGWLANRLGQHRPPVVDG